MQQSLVRFISQGLVGRDERDQIGFTDFKRAVYREYQHARHLEALDTALTAVSRYTTTREGINRLIVEMPPRHGKTVTTSRLFPAWHIGNHPDHRIILVSYSADLAHANSRAVRTLVDSLAFRSLFPGITLNRISRSVSTWELSGFRGGLSGLGILGSATGKGSNLLIIDDAVKSRHEAESEIIRERVWAAFNDDLMTRLEPGGAVVLMGTRWHTDDLIGRVLKYSNERWERLRFPALAEAGDPLGRAVGEALWPERFSQRVILDTQERLGAYSFASLYQQAPIALAGGLFKRAWFYPLIEREPPIRTVGRYWDLAMSSKTSADYSVGVKLGIGADGHYYVLDVARRQVEWGELTEWMATVMQADGQECLQGIEQQGYMSRAIQELNLDARLRGYRIFGYPKEVDKVTAALPFVARCAAGIVHVVDAHWSEQFIQELCVFDKGEHDDQVDAAAGAYAMLSGGDAIGEMNYAPAANISQW